ncbi:hypothetical protein Barb6_02128 [Bacteroidales bacterium Barb6]|nr:hypothetical protein Barb6_02128 [Bacteroidales bacterium Barb6]
MLMPQITDILAEIERLAPLSLQEEYDNAGVQAGNVHQSATGAILCLDVTEAVVDEALAKGCNLIISHHPLLFKPIKSLTGVTSAERCLIKACRHNLVIYAAHTNLDNAKDGVNYRLADIIGLQSPRILSPQPARTDAGSGIIGELPAETDPAAFLLHLKELFALSSLRHSLLPRKPVKKIALCGGSGAFLIKEAISQDADVFITGEAKYNDFYDVENHLLLAVIGHYESEVCTKDIFYSILKQKFPTFAAHFSNVQVNPVKYL